MGKKGGNFLTWENPGSKVRARCECARAPRISEENLELGVSSGGNARKRPMDGVVREGGISPEHYGGMCHPRNDVAPASGHVCPGRIPPGGITPGRTTESAGVDSGRLGSSDDAHGSRRSGASN